jgi:hypothetical protein
MLHHDCAPCHTAISVNDVLTKKGIPVVPKPPYSPDLSPCDFFLFPKIIFHLKGRHFGTVDNIQKDVTDQLRALPHENLQRCYREWEERLRQCVLTCALCVGNHPANYTGCAHYHNILKESNTHRNITQRTQSINTNMHPSGNPTRTNTNDNHMQPSGNLQQPRSYVEVTRSSTNQV